MKKPLLFWAVFVGLLPFILGLLLSWGVDCLAQSPWPLKNSELDQDRLVVTVKIAPEQPRKNNTDIVLVLDASDAMDEDCQGNTWESSDYDGISRWSMLKKTTCDFIDNVVKPGSGVRAGIVLYGGASNEGLMLPWDDHRIISGLTDDAAALYNSFGSYDFVSAQRGAPALRQDFFADSDSQYGSANLAAGFCGASRLLALSEASEKYVVVVGGGTINCAYDQQGNTSYNNVETNTQNAGLALKKDFANLKIYCLGLGQGNFSLFRPLGGENTYVDEFFSASTMAVVAEATQVISARFTQDCLVVAETGDALEVENLSDTLNAQVDVGNNVIWAVGDLGQENRLSFDLVNSSVKGESAELSCPAVSVVFPQPWLGEDLTIVREPQYGTVSAQGNQVIYSAPAGTLTADFFSIRSKNGNYKIEITALPEPLLKLD